MVGCIWFVFRVFLLFCFGLLYVDFAPVFWVFFFVCLCSLVLCGYSVGVHGNGFLPPFGF